MGKARSNLIFLTSYKKPGEASFKKYTCRHRCMIGKEAGTSLPGGRIRAEHVGGPLGESDLCLLKFEGHFIQPELVSFLEESGGDRWIGAVPTTGQGGGAAMNKMYFCI